MVQEEGTTNEVKGLQVVEPTTVEIEETDSSAGCGLWIGDEAAEEGSKGDSGRRKQEEQIENRSDYPVRVASRPRGQERQAMSGAVQYARSRGCSMVWSSDASIPIPLHFQGYLLLSSSGDVLG